MNKEQDEIKLVTLITTTYVQPFNKFLLYRKMNKIKISTTQAELKTLTYSISPNTHASTFILPFMNG